MGCHNLSRFSPINTCGHHKTCNHELITQFHEPHLGFRLLRCCAVKATLSHLLTYIYDRESRSPEPSSSTIIHCERTNKVFGNVLCDCSIASPNSSLRLVYLFVGRASTVIVYNASSSTLSSVFATPPSSKKMKHHMFSSL
jgi:hypothetical protein